MEIIRRALFDPEFRVQAVQWTAAEGYGKLLEALRADLASHGYLLERSFEGASGSRLFG